MTIALGGHTQVPTDTSIVWINKSDALRRLAQAKEGILYKDMANLLKIDTATLGARVRNLNSIIAVQSVMIDSYKRDSTNYQTIIDLTNSQKSLAISEANAWEKAYRKEKRKRFWTGVSGAVLTGTAILIQSRK